MSKVEKIILIFIILILPIKAEAKEMMENAYMKSLIPKTIVKVMIKPMI